MAAAVPDRIEPPAAAAASVAELRSRFRQGKAELLKHFGESRPTAPAATRLLKALARHVDATLIALWEDRKSTRLNSSHT